MPETSLDKVVSIVGDRLNTSRDHIKPESNLVHDLGADSLDLAELAMDIEDAFGLGFNSMPDPMPATVRELVAVVDLATCNR